MLGVLTTVRRRPHPKGIVAGTHRSFTIFRLITVIDNDAGQLFQNKFKDTSRLRGDRLPKFSREASGGRNTTALHNGDLHTIVLLFVTDMRICHRRLAANNDGSIATLQMEKIHRTLKYCE